MAKVSLRAYNREIETMIDRGQLDEAIAHSRHILKTYPKHLETYRLLGKAYLESKRYADAVDIFSRILVAVPDDFVAQVGMSIIRDEENKLEDAIWHMERAFETQPSNPAVQGELQRLYARRDGVRPPRIRMTRGALAHMYVQGELYPQAVSEIKSVLKDDPDRADMQTLLARAAFQSGSKNEAADVATALLRRYPYSLDANRVLAEILGSDHPETTQAYRQRVFELDPYAALVTGSLFLSKQVSDAAVNVERLDWNGQPVTMQPDWGEAKAISLESQEQQPDWLNQPLDESSGFGEIQSAPASIFGSPPPTEPAPAQPAEGIPDFLRAVGWGAATGAFDESKPVFDAEEPASDAEIEQGDLPDWVKAMKPAETVSPAQPEDEELPDWIRNIGMGAIAAQALDQSQGPADVPANEAEENTQWLSSEEKTESTPAGELAGGIAWLNHLAETEAAPAEAQDEDLDWLKDLSAPQEIAASSTPQEEEPDWLRGLGEPQAAPAEAQKDELDWLKDLGNPEEPASPITRTDEPDWLKGLGETEVEPAAAEQDDSDWIKHLGAVEETTPSTFEEEPPDWLKNLGETETTAPAKEEDQSDWLKGLTMAGGVAAAAFLSREDEPSEEEETPSVPAPSESEADFLSQLSEEPILPTTPDVTPSSMDVDQLGVTEQERDDSFAWLESLAAKQGATEGLLTKPEERKEEEPDWVKQAKGLTTPAEQPQASLEELGKSEQDQDDSFAWLESLAARQGATEGLLTKPEERIQEEPEWVKQAKDLNVQEPPQMEEPLVTPAPAAQAEQAAPEDEVEAWLQGLEGQETSTEPAGAADETAIWLRGLDERETPRAEEPVESPATDLPDWMKNIQEETEEKPASIFAEEAELGSTWMPSTEEPAPVAESKAEEDALPSWLNELDKEEEQVSAPANAEDLPAWLLADEIAPTTPEPTTFSDWKPSEEKWEEPFTVQEREPEQQEAEIPSVSLEMPEAETVLQPEQPQAEPEPAPVMEAREPQPEAAPRTETSGLNIPVVDPVLGMARNELSRSNVQGALSSYDKLIKKARYLDEVIYDLREALYRYPVDVSLWQSLGDAYMRANRLQDALDAYTKAEELLR